MMNSSLRGGSTTSLVAILDKASGMLDVCNVGDCNLLLIRNGKLVGEVGITQHSFNAPYQIRKDHRSALAYIPHSNRGIKCNTFQLHRGDVLLAGSDGLFDNVFKSDLVNCVNEHSTMSGNWDTLAENILQEALKNAKSNYVTPFTEEAQKNGWRGRTGGKKDDTSVVVAYLTD